MIEYQYFAILQGDKIAAITRAFPHQKLKRNQIELTSYEFWFLDRQKSDDNKGIDLNSIKRNIRNIEKKIKGVSKK